MEITLKIDDFEGPLDLLLHLIKEKKMDIFNLKLEVIIDEYLSFIEKMEEMNLDIASSYLVMASELLEIKSRLLLPRQEKIEEEEEDPKERLINRLIEYQRYKDLTSDFKNLEQERKQIYTRLPENLKEYASVQEVISNSDVTLDDLLKAFQKFLERKKLEEPLNTKVTKKEITVEERRVSIKRILKEKGKVNFLDLFEVYNKEYVVVTFLAILEMAKKRELKITQENRYGEIICEVDYE
ncbi:MAG: segregation/condensation protein A [Bacilli bacterium]|nr:segregation/condensation protein A [Bacilli bacterium]